MGYDKKIIDRCMILFCLDVEFAKDRCKDSSGYFTDDISNYSDLSRCKYGKLTDITENGYHVYQKDGNDWFAFFLPDFAVKKDKKYRPYTLEEFLNEGFEILVLVNKETGSEYHVRYNGFIKKVNGNCRIILGNAAYTLNELFECYTYLDSDGIFKPFGVEE